jgi:hypothetical protein
MQSGSRFMFTLEIMLEYCIWSKSAL